MDGVCVYKNRDGRCCVYVINTLSDELKERIKDNLVCICRSEMGSATNPIINDFNRVLKSLLDRIETKSEETRMGMIGELVLNVIIREFESIKIVSPFFNTETREIKKGFDIMAIDNDEKLRLIESKSGEISQTFNTATKKAKERINTAKIDLDNRLNSDNYDLWLNAVNSVKTYLEDNNEKNAIINIIENSSITNTSTDKNAVLGGIVFCDFDTTIDFNKIDQLYNSIKISGVFSGLRIIAIQKQSYLKIIEFLKLL